MEIKDSWTVENNDRNDKSIKNILEFTSNSMIICYQFIIHQSTPIQLLVKCLSFTQRYFRNIMIKFNPQTTRLKKGPQWLHDLQDHLKQKELRSTQHQSFIKIKKDYKH